jgi:hypothetical protein
MNPFSLSLKKSSSDLTRKRRPLHNLTDQLGCTLVPPAQTLLFAMRYKMLYNAQKPAFSHEKHQGWALCNQKLGCNMYRALLLRICCAAPWTLFLRSCLGLRSVTLDRQNQQRLVRFKQLVLRSAEAIQHGIHTHATDLFHSEGEVHRCVLRDKGDLPYNLSDSGSEQGS